MNNEQFIKKVKDRVKALDNYTLEPYGGNSDKHIVILGPDGTNTEHLRLYAYGGDIGLMPLTKEREYSLSRNINYAKYIREGYEDGNGQIYNVPVWLKNNKAVKKEMANKKITEEGLLDECLKYKEQKKINDCLTPSENNFYLPLILAAQYNKWTKKDDEKKERKVQCEMVKKFQKDCGKTIDREFVVTDMEFKFQLTDERCKEKSKGEGSFSKPDFVVFDGKAFGLIELKYNGQGYDENNDLDVHFLDFYDLVNDAKNNAKWDAYGECLKRLKILLDLEVIGKNDVERKKWLDYYSRQKKFYDDNQNNSFENELFWVGFYFVGGRRKANNRIKFRLLRNRKINDILRLETLRVYAGYCEKDERIFNLNKVIVAKKETEEVKDLFEKEST